MRTTPFEDSVDASSGVWINCIFTAILLDEQLE
jgi:hypothetical protein